MGPSNPRLRRAYEFGRLRSALVRGLPALGFGALASVLGAPPSGWWLAGLIFVLSGGVFFIGGRAARAIKPAFLIGAVPFFFSHVAQPAGHMCSVNGACLSWCLPACFVGGLLGGFWLVSEVRRREAGVAGWLLGSTVLIAVGAMGCHCVGFGSITGLIGGLMLSSGVRAVVPLRPSP